MQSGLPYTILRPGRLTDGPYTSYDLNTLLKATAGTRQDIQVATRDELNGETSRIALAGVLLFLCLFLYLPGALSKFACQALITTFNVYLTLPLCHLACVTRHLATGHACVTLISPFVLDMPLAESM